MVAKAVANGPPVIVFMTISMLFLKKKPEQEVNNVFKEYMQGGLTPEIQALLKAQVDIKQGLFSIKQAANFYDVEIMDIINFITESQEYDEYSRSAR
jgi:hypothetical protein